MGKRRIPHKSATEPVNSLLVRTVEGEIDLHGLDARGAELRLESFLSRWSGKPGKVVRVITGRGLRSDGAAVLKPLVDRLLRSRFATSVSQFQLTPDGGAYLVEMR